jgi:c-di-GMP-binding flagellar brake protein YcgR
VAPAPDCECRLQLRTRIRLLDIGLDGSLVAAETALPTNTAARVRMSLAASPFNSEVEVRRVAKAPDARPALGMAFTAMDEQSRRSLQEFLRRASL